MTHACGGEIVLTRGERTIRFPKRSITIETDYYQCTGCGEILLTPEQSARARREASDRIRRREGLLTTGEIRALRKEPGLRQRDFEKLLRVGRNTVARWEAGTVFQSPAVDNQMRLIRGNPQNAHLLAEWAGVDLPPQPLQTR